MKFCCDKFKRDYDLGKIYDGEKLIKELYPNIRIVKTQPHKFSQGENLLRFLFVCGFTKDNPPVINMKYCPFCGTHLFDFYKEDNYVNEDSKIFL